MRFEIKSWIEKFPRLRTRSNWMEFIEREICDTDGIR